MGSIPDAPAPRRAPGWLLPMLLLVVGAIGAALLYLQEKREIEEQNRRRFGALVEDATNRLEGGLQMYENAMHGAIGFLAAHPDISRRDWRAFTTELALEKLMPEINGIGLIVPVRDDQLPEFLAAIRRDGAPGFALRQVRGGDQAQAGTDTHFVITFIEPQPPNEPAVGLDVASEENRRVAAEAARDSGQMRITRRITLVQDGFRRAGFLVYHAYYAPGTRATNAAERRAAFRGWIFMPCVTENFVRKALGGAVNELALRLFEGASTAPENLLCDTVPDEARSSPFDLVTEVKLAGEVFTLGWHRRAGFAALDPTTPMLKAGAVSVATVLLAVLVATLQSARTQAQRRVDERTAQLTAVQSELQAANALQRGVLDNAGFAIISVRPDGIITTFNRTAEEMLGYRAEDLIGRTTPALLHLTAEVEAYSLELSAALGHPVAAGFDTFVARARERGMDEREWTYVRADGSSLPVHLTVSAIRDHRGEITGYLGTARDITEQKRIEHALRASEKRLGEVLSHADCLVWESAVDLATWEWRMNVHDSGLHRRLMGTDKPISNDDLWQRFEIPELAQLNADSRGAMERGADGYTHDFRLVRDGNTTWVRETVSIARAGPGKFWLVGVVLDISAQKEAEAVQRDMAALLAKLGSQVPGMIYQCRRRPDGTFSFPYASEGIRAVCGVSPEAAREDAACVFAVLHPDDATRVSASIEQSVAQLSEWKCDFRVCTDQTGERWVRGTSIPEREADGGILWHGFMSDITESKHLELRLRQNEERLSRMFGAMAEGIVVQNASGQIVEANPSAERILGLTREQLLGRESADPRWQTFRHDGTPFPAEEHPAMVTLRTGKPCRDVGMKVGRPDGTCVFISINCEALTDAAGKTVMVIASFSDVTAHREAALALSASESRFRQLADASPIGVFQIDGRGAFVYANARWQEITGLSGDDCRGFRYVKAFHPDDRKAAWESFKAAINARGDYLDEFRFLRPDGTVRWVRARATPMRDSTGAIMGFVGTNEDITTSRRASLVLQDSLDRFRTLAENAPVGIYLTDESGTCTFVNGRWSELSGVSADDCVSRGWLQALHPDDTARVAAAWQEFTAGRAEFKLDCRFVRPDGSLCWVSAHAVPRLDDNGLRVGFLSTISDVTVLKAAEERVRVAMQALAQQKFALDQHSMVSITDIRGTITYANDNFCRTYGYTSAELVGQNHRLLKSGVHPPDYFEMMYRTIERGEVWHGEMCNRSRHGRLLWSDSTIVPLRGVNGQIDQFIAIRSDITALKTIERDLKVARDQALDSVRLKSEFLANMSHEIRTPMNAVLGLSGLLLESPLSLEQQQMGHTIQSSAEGLLRIIDDLLDFSKLEAGKLRVVDGDFNLRLAIEEVVTLLRTTAHRKNLSLSIEWQNAVPAFLRGDEGRIRQVLLNLVGNAIKFTEKGGITLAVQAEPRDGGAYSCRVEVRDTGVGIAPDQQLRLFQPFTQADGSSSRKFGGTGLGLAISRQIVELMGGFIGLKSQPGQGSTFWFELVLGQPAAAGGSDRPTTANVFPAPSHPPVANPASNRILVAEDNPANQLVMKILLEKLGFQFALAVDGEAAVAELARGQYALVLMDCQMPRVDGYEATRRIRAGAGGERHRHMPVVALTAHVLAGEREKCRAAGMNEFLSKPVRGDQLLPLLARFGVTPRKAAPVVAPPPAPAPAPVAPAPVPAPVLVAPSPVAAVAPVAEAPAAPAPVLDLEHLNELAQLPGRDNARLTDDLIAMCLKELPVDFPRLREFVRDGKKAEGILLAHRLAGTTANLGAVALRAIMRGVELELRADRVAEAALQLSTLDRVWADTLAELRRFQQAPTA